MKPPLLGEGSEGRAPTLHRIPWNLPYNRKITEHRSKCNRMACGCSAPNTIRVVALAIAGDDLDWPDAPFRPWLSRQMTGSNLGQLKYLTRSPTRGVPISANFESKLSVRAMIWSENSGSPDPCVSLCYLRNKGHQ